MTERTLAELYSLNSKHSNYQTLAAPLRALLAQDSLAISSRHEAARLDYMLSKTQLEGKTVADIGGNTGFFTLECATRGAARVLYYEGNAAHAEFVTVAARALQLDNVTTHARYLDFHGDFGADVDLCLLLNVLHHLGDDYGDSALQRDAAKRIMLDSLANMARHTRAMAFQLGFNWKGDRRLPLFDQGTKAELIDFIRQGTAADWDIAAVGIAQRGPDGVAYHDLDQHNIARDDSLGEFLNRPLFMLVSKHF